MNFEVFSEGDSVIHRLDPRFKILSATLLIVVTAVLNNFRSVLLVSVFAAFSVSIARLKLKHILYRLFFPNALIIVLWLFIPFSTSGDTLFTLFGLNATWQGIDKALLITIKCNTILLVLISYISTTSTIVLGQALSRLGVNRKLSYILFFFCRYLEVIYSELQRLSDSLKVRGFRPSTNMHTYKTFANLVGMLLVRSWERSERIYSAMICRGFNGDFYSIAEFKSARLDYMFLLLSMTVGIAAVLM